MSLVSPYKNIFQYTRISLAPYNLNSDIKNNIMFKLKNSIEKKRIENYQIQEKILKLFTPYMIYMRLMMKSKNE